MQLQLTLRVSMAAMENPTQLQLEMRQEWISKAMLEKVMINLKDIEARVKASAKQSVDISNGRRACY